MWHTCILCFAGKSIISNDGATILKNLDIVHPAAKTLVDIAKSQDAEVSTFTSMNFQNLFFDKARSKKSSSAKTVFKKAMYRYLSLSFEF